MIAMRPPSRTAAGPARAGRLLVLLAAAACASAPPQPELPRTHPASPAADEAPEAAPSTTLVMPERSPPPTDGAPKRGH